VRKVVAGCERVLMDEISRKLRANGMVV